MKLVALTTIKNGGLKEALETVGWRQADLARECGFQPSALTNLVTMKCKPSENVLNRIQKAFGSKGLYVPIEKLWPPDFKGFGKALKFEQTKDIDNDLLLDYGQQQQFMLEDSKHSRELFRRLEYSIPKLLEDEKRVIEGLVDGKCVAHIARELNMSPTTVNRRYQQARSHIREIEMQSRIQGIDLEEAAEDYCYDETRG
jgi:transcriptional regulator with XRE-family HTH domain